MPLGLVYWGDDWALGIFLHSQNSKHSFWDACNVCNVCNSENRAWERREAISLS